MEIHKCKRGDYVIIEQKPLAIRDQLRYKLAIVVAADRRGKATHVTTDRTDRPADRLYQNTLTYMRVRNLYLFEQSALNRQAAANVLAGKVFSSKEAARLEMNAELDRLRREGAIMNDQRHA